MNQLSKIAPLKVHGATITYRDDQIIHIHYDSILMSLKDAKNIIDQVKEKSPWKIAPIYISAEPFASNDPEAQKYLAGDEVMNHSSAVGILAKNIAQKIAINFFIKFRKPTKPTKFFTSEDEAITWLQRFETIVK